MQIRVMQRAALRAWLAADAALREPIVTDGLVMDKMASAFVRLARTIRPYRGGAMALRRRYAATPALTGLRPDWSVRTRDMTVAGLRARQFEPAGAARATMLYFHGGGFISGSLETHDALCRRLAARVGMRVVSVEYRLAPEHPFPAGHDDAAAAWRWARAHLPGPLLVGGDSAGANLAAGIGVSGEAALQVLIYPPIDLLHQNGRYPSIELFGAGFMLTKEFMRECAAMLIPPGQDAGDPRLSPIRGDLSRASPAVVVAAGFDPLRDQGTAYVKALRGAGGRAHLLFEAGLGHGFADFAGVVPAARLGVDRIAGAIRSELEMEGAGG
jgi:acetyl esterase